MTALELSRYIKKAKRMSSGWWSGCCPAHADKNPGLNWCDGDSGNVIIKCHAGCSREAILAALGIDNTTPRASLPKDNGMIYQYYTAAGNYISEKVKNNDPGSKSRYVWRTKDGRGGYTMGRLKDQTYLYGLPELAGLQKDDTVYIAEGEKDVETLRRHGLVAVSGADGAGHGKFPKEVVPFFKDLNVVIFQDNDKVGKDYALEEARAIAPVTESIKIIELQDIWPEIYEHADISDYLVHFGDAAFEQVIALIERTPCWTASQSNEAAGGKGLTIRSVKELMQQHFEPAQFVVNGILPKGLALLASPPKFGKSWFALELCLAVAKGEPFLGLGTSKTDVLYCDLEDGDAELQERIKKG